MSVDANIRDYCASLGRIPPNTAAFLSFASHPSKSGGITYFQTESLFLSVPSNLSARARAVLLASTPHLAGSDGDFVTALNTLSHFQSALGIIPPPEPPIYDAGSSASQSATLSASERGGGIHAWIDTYFPVLNMPVSHSVAVVAANGTTVWRAPLEEVDYSEPSDTMKGSDPASTFAHTVPAWHGLSKNGSAVGHLLNASYGTPEDYEALKEQGINTAGCIALVMYGKMSRSLKVKAAEEAGCGAALIYTDLTQDGVVTFPAYEVYPSGPARQPTTIERGSVSYIQRYVGDPSTPGVPAYPNVTRSHPSNLPGIPSLPLSHSNAVKLLAISAEEEGRTVRVVNEVDSKVVPIWNVMAVIPGHLADEVVVLGGHRDAWVMGAADPISGMVSMHEIVNGLSVLLKSGWKPLRTIIVASWDAEEFGMIGSTEWAEDFEEWIGKHVVAYLNVDVSAGGSRLQISASPSLAHFLRGTAQAIPHATDPGRTFWDARFDNGPFNQSRDAKITPQEARTFTRDNVAWYDTEQALRATMMAQSNRASAMRKTEDIGIGIMGSGSDFTAFLHHIGIASADGGFHPTQTDAAYHYHSVYGSLRWVELYGDPGYHRQVTFAKYLGLATLRLADAIILPINTTHYAYELSYYLQRVEDLAGAGNISFSGLQRAVESLQHASIELDKEKTRAEKELGQELEKLLCGCRSDVKHYLDKLVLLMQRTFRLRTDDTRACPDSSALSNKVSRELTDAASRARTVNRQLASFEASFILPTGLPNRKWYRNLLMAPGILSGYGATTFPGVTEALTVDRNVTLAQVEIEHLIDVITKATKALEVKPV